jgi:hypothetical protein
MEQKEKNMFFGDFTSKRDICEQFRITDFDGTVIFAAYEYEDYSGSAEVIFVHDGKFFMAQGGHCSCNGLEDQWEPIEMPIDGLRRIIGEGSGMLSKFRDGLSEALEMIEVLNLEGASPDVVYTALKLAYG